MHFCRVEPYTQRIVGSKNIHLTNTSYARQPRLDIYFHVVGQCLGIITTVRAVQSYKLQVGVLRLAYSYAALCHFGWQQSLSRSYTVLHIHQSHVGVRPLLEVYGYGASAVVGGCGSHILHVFHTV